MAQVRQGRLFPSVSSFLVIFFLFSIISTTNAQDTTTSISITPSTSSFTATGLTSTTTAPPKPTKTAEPDPTIKDHIKCYALPYGVLGTINHLLHYETLWALSRGRQPLRPWHPLDVDNWKLTLANAIATFAITVP